MDLMAAMPGIPDEPGESVMAKKEGAERQSR